MIGLAPPRRPRLLLADRVKGQADSFLRPLLAGLHRGFEVRFVSLPPASPALAEAIDWADLVWFEWCWDHAVWATRSGALQGRPCVVRLHSIEALQTDFPGQLDWSQVSRLVTVGKDITDALRRRFPVVAAVPTMVIPNGIDLERFVPGRPDRDRIAWVGHIEPKKNPMLMLQIAHRLRQVAPEATVHVAGAVTDLRTAALSAANDPGTRPQRDAAFRRRGDRHASLVSGQGGVLLSTTMYESFGMNIGEAMAVGAFPVVHDFPGADLLWPAECLFASVDEAVALIRAATPGLHRPWVAERYDLERQELAVLAALDAVLSEAATLDPPSPRSRVGGTRS